MQLFAVGNIAREVVVAVKYPGAGIQRSLQSLTVLVQGHIQHGYPRTRFGMNLLQQVDIPFYAGHQLRFPGLSIAQLGQCTQAVGIAIEYVEISHGVSLFLRDATRQADYNTAPD